MPAVATKPGAGPRHLLFHPNGRFVYATNELDGTVDSYLELGRDPNWVEIIDLP